MWTGVQRPTVRSGPFDSRCFLTFRQLTVAHQEARHLEQRMMIETGQAAVVFASPAVETVALGNGAIGSIHFVIKGGQPAKGTGMPFKDAVQEGGS